MAGSEDDWSKAELLTDRSTTSEKQYFMTMSDISDYVQVCYRLTKVPREHQIRAKAQVLAFFDERHVKIPTSLYIRYENMMERGFFRVPSETEVETEFTNASTTLIPAIEDMA